MADAWDQQDEKLQMRMDGQEAESLESLLARVNKMKISELIDHLKRRNINVVKLKKKKKKMQDMLSEVLEQEQMSIAMTQKKKSSMKFPPFDGKLDDEPLSTLKVADLKLEIKKRGYKCANMKHEELVDKLHEVMEEEYNQMMMQQFHDYTFQEWKQQANENKPHFFSQYDIHRQLVLAARSGEVAKVRSLLLQPLPSGEPGQTVDINYQNPLGETALIAASYNGQLKVVQLLIEQNARTDIVNKKQESALACASMGGHREVVEALKSRWKLRKPDLASMMSRSISANYEGVPAYGTADQNLIVAQQMQIQETSTLQILNNLKKKKPKPSNVLALGSTNNQSEATSSVPKLLLETESAPALLGQQPW